MPIVNKIAVTVSAKRIESSRASISMLPCGRRGRWERESVVDQDHARGIASQKIDKSARCLFIRRALQNDGRLLDLFVHVTWNFPVLPGLHPRGKDQRQCQNSHLRVSRLYELCRL